MTEKKGLKDEYDFSQGERGKHFIPPEAEVTLNLNLSHEPEDSALAGRFKVSADGAPKENAGGATWSFDKDGNERCESFSLNAQRGHWDYDLNQWVWEDGSDKPMPLCPIVKQELTIEERLAIVERKIERLEARWFSRNGQQRGN